MLRAVVHDGVLRLCGELCLGSAPAAAEALQRQERGTRGRVVVDLRGLSFIDLAGLDVLVDAAERLGAAGRQLVVILGSCSARLLEVLHVAVDARPGAGVPVWRPAAELVPERQSVMSSRSSSS